MFVNHARCALAAVLAAGALSLPAPAAAAPPAPPAPPGPGACLIGTWTMTRYSMVVKGRDIDLTTTGGQGTRLTVTKQNATYDFGDTRRTVTKGTRSGQPVSLWAAYRGRLTMQSKFRGAQSGIFTTKAKSAAGNATGVLGQAYPQKKVLARYSLVQAYHRGMGGALTPVRANFKCNERALRFHVKKKDFFGASVVNVVYRRS